ncbi:hypothetical protein [Pleionea mediterranea]|uniref:Uncharacterized protein n=1 Tax=Pleionea mediterranea TaxID=523701 RepID=A0A316FX85_9GAMM|nr:hypothetical protein [Pleionea mediterranea]PWK52932.1 hypothetical protein C8D97_104150 [Pleionea mediterranea]
MMLQYFSRQFYWLLFIAVFALTLLWIINHPSDRQSIRLHNNMMAMTTMAFQEAIVFTHMKYHASANRTGAILDLVQLDHHNIDFNQHGFPVGTDHTESSVILPITTRNCRQLWIALLQPMSPMLQPDPYASLKAEAINGKCVFTSLNSPSTKITYSPVSGRVAMNTRN